jgi:hypothetical protein
MLDGPTLWVDDTKNSTCKRGREKEVTSQRSQKSKTTCTQVPQRSQASGASGFWLQRQTLVLRTHCTAFFSSFGALLYFCLYDVFTPYSSNEILFYFLFCVSPSSAASFPPHFPFRGAGAHGLLVYACARCTMIKSSACRRPFGYLGFSVAMIVTRQETRPHQTDRLAEESKTARKSQEKERQLLHFDGIPTPSFVLERVSYYVFVRYGVRLSLQHCAIRGKGQSVNKTAKRVLFCMENDVDGVPLSGGVSAD